MPWSGSGTYSLPPAYSPEVNGTVIDATRYNGLTTDVASGITAALAKNGENVPTANLPMGGFKHTGVADGNAAGQYIAFGQATAVSALTITALTAGNLNVTSSTIPANGLYLKAANNPALSSNTTLRWDVNSTGNHVFAAPSSGIPLAVGAGAGGAVSISYVGSIGEGADKTLSSTGTTLLVGEGAAWQTLHLRTASSTRVAINNAGNVTINAPSSGSTLTIGQIAGGNSVLAQSSLSGSDMTIRVENTSNTANSHARVSHVVAGASAGDAYSYYTVSSVTDWTIGLDNSDSDSFKMSQGSSLGTNDRFVVTTDGRLYGNALHNNGGAVTGTTNQYIASGTYTPTWTNVSNTSAIQTYSSQWIRVGNVVTVSGMVDIDPTSASSSTGARCSLPIATNFTFAQNGAGVAARQKNSTTGLVAYIAADTAVDEMSLNFFCDGDAANWPWQFHFTYLIQ